MILIIMLIFFLLLVISVPIPFAMIAATIVYILRQGTPLYILVHRMFEGINTFPLIAVPLFIFAGEVMNSSGITTSIFSFANCLVRHVRGGLGHANVIASMIFAGMSGSAVADAGGLGKVELKAMKDAGYDLSFSAAITAASSSIGPIIPPSIPLVIYGIVAEVSIIKLFIAGIIPGVLIGIALMCTVYLKSNEHTAPKAKKRASFDEIKKSFIKALPALGAPVILLGGTLTGVFTPTEAAAVCGFYGLLISEIFYEGLNLKVLLRIGKKTLLTSGSILIIISAASLFSWLVTMEHLPSILISISETYDFTANQFLFFINIFFLILGCFITPESSILLLTPILLPLVKHLGIDPVQFGVVFVLNMMIGLFTPPVGLCLFVLKDLSGLEMSTIFKAMLPFLVSLIIVLIMISYIPWITLYLPRMLR